MLTIVCCLFCVSQWTRILFLSYCSLVVIHSAVSPFWNSSWWLDRFLAKTQCQTQQIKIFSFYLMFTNQIFFFKITRPLRTVLQNTMIPSGNRNQVDTFPSQLSHRIRSKNYTLFSYLLYTIIYTISKTSLICRYIFHDFF